MSRSGRGARPEGMSRRSFLGHAGLGALGAGALASGAASCTFLQRAFPDAPPIQSPQFGRLFPDLQPFATASVGLGLALIDLGKPGGSMDPKDPLSAGAERLLNDPALNTKNPDNPTHTAGTTFFGQYVDHDLTLDRLSILGIPRPTQISINLRSPALDLDSLYGGGPSASPQLYDPRDAAKLKIESGGAFEDLPRDGNGTAVVGDPREDENLVIAGIHCAFINFHNNVVDHVRTAGQETADVFARARQTVTWHYQWIILHEFLPQVVGQGMVDDILANGRKHYRTPIPQIPVEFQTGAYRFGHAIVRPSYRANATGNGGQPFDALTFDPAGDHQTDPVDLRGGKRAPRRYIGWETFFDFGDGKVMHNKIIAPKMASPLFRLPLGAIVDGTPATSLATRDLLRHVTWGVPSGQAIAQAMGAPVLRPADFPALSPYRNEALDRNTPLMYYVMREAELQHRGHQLGTVGGRIVAETLIGLLQQDNRSILRQRTPWRPTLPTRHGSVSGAFTMTDLLTFAGVDPKSRGGR